jgi:intracellular septation protein A
VTGTAIDFQIPRVREIARHALPRVAEGTIVPLAIFLLALRLAGVEVALAGGLVWTYGAITTRLVMRRPVPGIVAVGALTATARVALALMTGNVFFYFLQPTLGTALVGAAFLVSATLRRPLAEKLAHDFCPLPSSMTKHPRVRTFFLHVSLLWGAVFLANAGLTLWLLLDNSITTFVIARPFVSGGFTVTGILLSVLWFKQVLRRHGPATAAVVA